MRRFRALVEVELDAPDDDAVDDRIHAVFEAGDPMDALNAVVWTKDVAEVEADGSRKEASA